MRLFEKYRPRSLDEIHGQLPIRLLKSFAANPYKCCFLLEGPPGVGKSASALALAHELGCDDELSGLHEIVSTELSIDRCRELFEVRLRMRPMEGNGWHVLLIEELEACGSAQVQRYLKVALETKLPERCVVIATSNGAGALEKALLQRFKVYCFSGGEFFAKACVGRLIEIWGDESDGAPMPWGWQQWGWDGEQFSMRQALDALQDQLTLAGVAA